MIFKGIDHLINVLIKLTVFHLSLFYKRNTKWTASVIQILVMSSDFLKAKTTHLAVRVFSRIAQISQHPARLDQSI